MEKIFLWQEGAPSYRREYKQEQPSVTPYIVPGARGAIIICPGGGYTTKAPHECQPIAEAINAMGVSAFTLDYRVAPYEHPIPLKDAQRAIRLVRSMAHTWGIDKNKIGILGFSAGGHLTATAATQYDDGFPESEDIIQRESSRPDCAIPCYAVISLKQWLSGRGGDAYKGYEKENKKLMAMLSPEDNITENTPPMFIWHTSEDAVVSVEHSINLASALARNGVKFALHIFPYGRHGIGLAHDTPLAGDWVRLLSAWLCDLGYNK